MVDANPEFAAELGARIGAIYADAAEELTGIITRRVTTGGVDDATWAQIKLAEISRLRKEVNQTMGRVTPFAKVAIADTMQTAYMAGASQEGQILGGWFQGNPRTIAALEKEAMKMADDARVSILRTTQDVYRKIIADTATGVSIGTKTRQQASARALQKFADQGITGFVDKAGRQWEIETYAEMAMRTSSGRAAIQGGMDRIEENGHDLVIVSNAPEECSMCRPWEGKVLSISGNTRGGHIAGSVAKAREAGLLHPNCRHNLTAYIPGLTTIPTHTEDPEGDEIRKEHRSQERTVRKAKRRTQVLARQISETRKAGQAVDPNVMNAYRRAQANQTKTMDEYLSFLKQHDRKRLRYREVARGGNGKRFGPQDYVPLAKQSTAPKLTVMKNTPNADVNPSNWLEKATVKWGKVPKDLQKKYTDAAQSMIDKYPIMAEHVTKFGRLTELGVKDQRGMLAATAHRPSDPFNVTVGVANTREMVANLTLNEAEGWLAVGTPKGLIDHEFGHVAEIVINSRTQKRAVEEVYTALWEAYGHGTRNPTQTRWIVAEAKKKVSRYAQSSDQEFIAECWSAYHGGKTNNKVVKVVGEAIDRLLKEAAS